MEMKKEKESGWKESGSPPMDLSQLRPTPMMKNAISAKNKMQGP
jgi:hypothetical protein